MNFIRNLRNRMLVATDPELRAIKQVISESVALSRGNCQTEDCDRIFIDRLKNVPDALKMSFWQNHFEWQALERYPEVHGHILDFGCGSGHSDILLARKGYQIHGIDLSTVGISIGKYLISREPDTVKNRVSLEYADVTKKRTGQVMFDSGWSSHVFEHISDPEPVLSGLKQWLKPGAPLLISVPLGYAYDDPGHVNHFCTVEELKQFLGNGITVTRMDISQEFQVIRALCTL